MTRQETQHQAQVRARTQPDRPTSEVPLRLVRAQAARARLPLAAATRNHLALLARAVERPAPVAQAAQQLLAALQPMAAGARRAAAAAAAVPVQPEQAQVRAIVTMVKRGAWSA